MQATGIGRITLWSVVGVAAAAAAWAGSAPAPAARAAGADEIEAACLTTNPYVAVALIEARADLAKGAGPAPDSPAILALRDTAADDPAAQLTLALASEVGSVYGMAYDAPRRQLYAAAFLRRGAPFGPAGPGAIYRVEQLPDDSFTVAPWVTLDAGSDPHAARGSDAEAELWVGRRGLGDLEIDDTGRELFAANLYDGRIHRRALPDGGDLGSIPNGGIGQPWYNRARLFGLAYADGWLYHGLVDTGQGLDGRGQTAYVFRSRADGSEMAEVLNFRIDDHPPGRSWLYPAPNWPPIWQGDTPVLTDLEVRPGGGLVVALRNRGLDASPVAENGLHGIAPLGQIVVSELGPDGLQRVVTDLTGKLATTTGSVARLPGMDVVAVPLKAGAVGGRGGITDTIRTVEPHAVRVGWLSLASGAVEREERLSITGPWLAPSVPGDVEVLCAAETGLDPERGATSTAEIASGATATVGAAQTQAISTVNAWIATATAYTTQLAGTATAYATVFAGTATAAAATGTHAAEHPGTPAAAYADVVRRSCESRNPFYVVPRFAYGLAAVPDPDSIAAKSPALIAFDGSGDSLTMATQGDLGTVYGVAYDWRREHIYAGAWHTHSGLVGPAGGGAIYRLDLRTGQVGPWQLQNTGPALHEQPSFTASPWAGKAGWGDLELSADGAQLFAVNMYERRIYRFSVPDGRFLGSFAHGADDEPWGATARPMALGVRGGRLYHGVVDTGELRDTPFEARVYESWPDGSGMRQVASFDLDYVVPDLGGAPRWVPWEHGFFGGGSQALLSDIEFTRGGDLVVGLRDRGGDAYFSPEWGSYSVIGDILLGRRTAEGWDVVPVPKHYRERGTYAVSVMGALAAVPRTDEVVSTAYAPVSGRSVGAAWFGNPLGNWIRGQTLVTSQQVVTDPVPVHRKFAGNLGDIEILCPPDELPPPPSETPTPTESPSPTPTSTRTPTPTSTPTPTPTSTPTPTPTPTLTPTATPVPEPIYLPLVYNRFCVPFEERADVVLVLDLSTSMEGATREGRTKLAAALGAARQFIAQMRLEADTRGRHDRVAVVGFNDRAWTAMGLTNDRAAIEAAIAALPGGLAQGTRLDLGFHQGQAAIAAGPRGEASQPVLILLTDGLPNRVPTPQAGGSQEDTVLAAAAAVRAAGTRVFTIGLGLPDEVPRELLERAASEPGGFSYAPDGEDLAAIYARIAGKLTGCP